MTFKRAAAAAAFSLLFLSAGAMALPAKITSGQMLLGGTAFGTPDYQTYLRFDMSARTEMPRRVYRFDAEQAYSVFLDHPSQPNGEFEYAVVLPYGPQRISVNGQLYFPVWYGDGKWRIRTSAVTPEATPDSPQFLDVFAAFSMSGSAVTVGAFNTGLRISGVGTVRMRFEKIRGKYYVREALYAFGDSPFPDPLTD